MVKKKLSVALVFTVLFVISEIRLFAQNLDADSSDVVVLLDVSQSVLPYFHDVTDFVVSSVVRDYVRRGDVFHLLGFGGETQVEIAQKMETESDVKSVLGRLYLLYPLALYSDFAQSLDSLYTYMSDLPPERPKVAVIITDGIQNPPKSSPTYALNDEEITKIIESNAAKIRARGWPVHIIKLPFAKSGGSTAGEAPPSERDGRSFIDAAARSLGAPVSEFQGDDKENIALRTLGVHTAEFPGHLGTRDYMFSFPLRITNGTSEPARIELREVMSDGADILEHPTVLNLAPAGSGVMNVPIVLPSSIPEGDQVIAVQLTFAHGARVSPRDGSLSLTLKQSFLGSLLRSNARVLILIVVIVLAIAAFIAIVLIIRRAGVRIPIAAAVFAKEPKSGDSSLLRSAAARSAADRRARESAAESAAEAMARERRDAAIRDAELLAHASAHASAHGRAHDSAGGGSTAREMDEYESSVEKSAKAIAAQQRAEAERSAALLASALPRYTPSAPSKPPLRSSIALPYRNRIVKQGTIRIELRVEEQNPHIGLRNVHAIGAGMHKSVGGGSSDYLIFLVRVPRRAADLHFDGEKLIFVPLRLELFPSLAGPIEDCLGVDIPMISSSGYPLTLRFIEYEEPAKRINRLLHCIDVPGLN